MSIEGFAEVEAFLLYVEHFLCPSSKCSQTIKVMHNLQVYKVRRGRKMLDGQAARWCLSEITRSGKPRDLFDDREQLI
jgi:hypothetical protein